MKRKSKLAKARAVKRESKAAGMKNPGGESRYAKKKYGEIEPGPAQSRASWFLRHGIQAAIDRVGLEHREHVAERRRAEERQREAERLRHEAERLRREALAKRAQQPRRRAA
jgi:hypothetical protein